MGLERFLNAQNKDYETALSEIKNGRKQGHWMWYIFPQIEGLGSSATSHKYAVKNIQEATDYLMDKKLGIKLTNICKALLELPTDNATEVFGTPDDMKLKSCMTLFEAVPATFPVFGQVIDKFFKGERDERTLQILSSAKENQ